MGGARQLVDSSRHLCGLEGAELHLVQRHLVQAVVRSSSSAPAHHQGAWLTWQCCFWFSGARQRPGGHVWAEGGGGRRRSPTDGAEGGRG